MIAQSGNSGAVGNKYKYGPFGESATLTGTTIGYTGQRYDSETGLYHYKARYYLPAIGRFLQADPIGYSAGMNLYAYVGNDPMDHTDPLGLDPDLGIFGPGVADVSRFATWMTSRHDEHVADWLAKPHTHQENAVGALHITPLGPLAAEGAAVLKGAATTAKLRRLAVSRAWEDEQALIKAGKRGTRDWNDAERLELRNTGKVKGYDGHHTLDVKRNPLHAPDERRIEFVKKGKPHAAEHQGGFRGPSKEPKFFDRKAMLLEN